MPHYEYKVVPAPAKGLKARGLKTPEARFAHSVESLLNTLGAEGWDYLRAELLPSDERSGLTGSTTNWRNVLVFRRVVASDAEDFQPRVLEVTEPKAEPVLKAVPAVEVAEAAEPEVEPVAEPEPEIQPEPDPEPEPVAESESEPEAEPVRDTPPDVRDLVLQFSTSSDRRARKRKRGAPDRDDPEQKG